MLQKEVGVLKIWEKIMVGLFSSRPSSSSSQDCLPIARSLAENRRVIEEEFSNSSDFVSRELVVGGKQALLCYLKGITDSALIEKSITAPLLEIKGPIGDIEEVMRKQVSAVEYSLSKDVYELVTWILQARAVVLIDGEVVGAGIEAAKLTARAVEEPAAEKAIVGPREGFIERLPENLSLIRRRLPTAAFKSVVMYIGSFSRTKIAICYLEDQVSDHLLKELMARMRHAAQRELPAVLDATYLQEVIEDHPLSPFPQMIATERPDKAVGNLLEGRIIILIDGTPFALIAPAALPDFFHTAEDYYLRPLATSVARWLRYLAAITIMNISAVYVALMTYHYELIPTRLIVNVAEFRVRVPFTPIAEALALEGVVELLREATNRLPATVGQVIGVVGALVLGQAAVQANLVSPLLVIVVALSTIASFAIPNNVFATAIRLMRFPIIVAAGFL